MKDADSVSWFNRTRVSSKAARDIKTIPGSFYKARERGCVSMADSDELTKFYKRSLVTCFALMAHSLFFVQWSYGSRILTKARFPRAFEYMPYVVYPVVLTGAVVFIMRKNWELHERLDSKYTPIWLRVSQKTLFDDDDDDEDDMD